MRPVLHTTPLEGVRPNYAQSIRAQHTLLPAPPEWSHEQYISTPIRTNPRSVVLNHGFRHLTLVN
jgi:hypothetical protein